MNTPLSIPTMLRRLRHFYRARLRDALDAAGLEDLPDHGAAALGVVARGPAAGRDLAQALGLSKQSASQLIDSLVTRGYAERQDDAQDRRRVLLRPTPRGLAAARLARDTVRAADATLRARIGAAAFDAFATTLATLTTEEAGHDPSP